MRVAVSWWPPADFDEPLEVVKHLFVGSEGTFGFVSRATYHSVPDYKDKASAFIVFPTVEDASNATWELRKAGCTDAVELFDRRSLRELPLTCKAFTTLHTPSARRAVALMRGSSRRVAAYDATRVQGAVGRLGRRAPGHRSADEFGIKSGTCEDFEHLHFLRGMSDTATALLIECRGDTPETLQVIV